MFGSSKDKWFSSWETRLNVKADIYIERERERNTLGLKLKFINTCKNPIKILQFMAVKQVYMLESLEISHRRQIIWCFMNYQSSKTHILTAQHRTLRQTRLSYSAEILFYLLLLTRVIPGKYSLIYSITGRDNGAGNCKEIHLSFLAIMWRSWHL